ncbi:hypothetical protein B0H14DRAFT_2564436 [Mycena olivaceomarginata]|nr:hypothetical protein B0H14DRAFT_2564436 [Mycena olivaceomarginata]
MDNALRNLLFSLTGNSVEPYPAPHVPGSHLGIPWNLMMEDADIPLIAEEQGVANIATAILHCCDELPEERSDNGNPTVPESVVPDFPSGTDQQECRLRRDSRVSVLVQLWNKTQHLDFGIRGLTELHTHVPTPFRLFPWTKEMKDVDNNEEKTKNCGRLMYNNWVVYSNWQYRI